jgi:hypothetical protein
VSNRIGSNFVAHDLSEEMNEAVADARPKADNFQTPYKMKYTCPREDARYFTIGQDFEFWNSPAYGVVAMNEKDFCILAEKNKNADIFTIYTEAKSRADAINCLAYDRAIDHRSSQPIVVPPGVNHYKM